MVCLEWMAVLGVMKDGKAWKTPRAFSYALTKKEQVKRLTSLDSYDYIWAWEGEKPQEWTCSEVEKNKTIIGKLLGIFK